jgi:hypothetical protein
MKKNTPCLVSGTTAAYFTFDISPNATNVLCVCVWFHISTKPMDIKLYILQKKLILMSVMKPYVPQSEIYAFLCI